MLLSFLILLFCLCFSICYLQTSLYLHFFLFSLYLLYVLHYLVVDVIIWFIIKTRAQGEQKNYNYMGKQYHINWVYPREKGVCWV